MNFNKLYPLMVLTTVLLGLGVQTARADSIYFDLTVGNPDISSYAGPYAEVTVNRTSTTTATITFLRYSNFLLGGEGIGGVNVNAASSTVGSFTSSGTASDLTATGVGNEDGFGSFNQTVKNFDGFKHAVTQFSFVLTNTAGTWATASVVLTPNAGGSTAAAHIFVPNTGGTAALSTGYAGNGANSDVPDGGTTASLLGLALGAGALVMRRKR